MFRKILIANRGEIALRVIRACREMGIASVAVHSTADADAMHVRMADEALCIGPPPATDSYLSMPAIISACEITGAEAIHPGYGFLSENAQFVQIVEDHGLTFIGPSAEHIRMMGDKITAKDTMKALGVPCVPGSDGGVADLDAARSVADAVGYPVIVKATAGGGGRGMKLARSAVDLEIAFRTARSEAKAAFGNDEVYLEKYLGRPRHIEVQVFGDGKGAAVHLGERDCSLQRRHQKVLEEAPGPVIDAATRERIGTICAEAVARIGYRGAGTIEFLYEDGEFYFIEMNTRLQVEHPVTELVWGLDLVEQQLRVAAGEPLGFTQDDLSPSGHAVEARLYAEDPAQGFVPSPGRIAALRLPTPSANLRVDHGVIEGQTVTPHYDPMLAKIIARGTDRAAALARLDAALAEIHVAGIVTNAGFLRRLLTTDEVVAGDLDTELVDRRLAGLVGRDAGLDEPSRGDSIAMDMVAALVIAEERASRADQHDPWGSTSGWRIGEPAWTTWRARDGEREVVIETRGGDGTYEVRRAGDGDESGDIQFCEIDRDDDGRVEITVNGRRWRGHATHVGADAVRGAGVQTEVWVSTGGHSRRFVEREAVRTGRSGGSTVDGTLRSPMPGTVVAVAVGVGDEVTEGQVLAVVEAMKMEHSLRAPFDGVVAEVPVTPGRQVDLGAAIVVVEQVEPHPAPEDDERSP